MNKNCVMLLAMSLATVTLCSPALFAWTTPEETKVTEIAPGVFFRKAQTAPVFTGCNQGWVVFKDYVLVIDANFPGQAEEVFASIRKTTDKPIRYVFDTHYHGDHADGNMQYSKIGATVIAHERSQPLFLTKGKEGFNRSLESRAKEYGGLTYELPSLYFSHKMVFDDGDQRVELHFFGHAHTAGDAVAWLPKHKILFTGDACVNGAFNYTGDSSTESWIAVLGSMEELGVKTLCPGHGEYGGPEVIANQKRYFRELRESVGKMIAGGKSLDTIKKEIAVPFYKEWTGVDVTTRGENIEHVFKELNGNKTPLKETSSFRSWNRMPGKEGYGKLEVLEKAGETLADLRWDRLADLFLVSSEERRDEIKAYFAEEGRRDDASSMDVYLRRVEGRFDLTSDRKMLQRAFAIQSIRNSSDNLKASTLP